MVFSSIDDSKRISAKKRDHLYDMIYDSAVSVDIGVVDAFEIDRINILNAALMSMRIALKNLFPQPDYLLVDGTFRVSLSVSQNVIKKDDTLSVFIGEASIIAKITRDRMMTQADLIFPEFKFARHKGYPTKLHREKISSLGYCYMHRKTFKGVREAVSLSLVKPRNYHNRKETQFC